MLPAGHRLRSGREFRLTTRRGRRAGTPTVVVHGREATDVSTQVGFVVSRRVGSAVARNRVKRRLRHLMATRLTRLPAGSRVVVRALPSAASASGAELARDLDKALRRLTDSGGVRR